MLIENKSSSDYILDSSRDYAVHVCENRAIPHIKDGLKDSQRRALWAIRNKSDKIKTVSLSGEMITHCSYTSGDVSASGAISMLAAPYCNNIPLLEGIGTFGTRVAPVEGIASPRYTYVKRGKTAQYLVFHDLDIVPLKENYDGSLMEPVHFLPLIPLVLLNGVSGIAVGYSTEILPRAFKELVDATITILDGKILKELKPTYQYLDCDVKHLEENTWQISGKAHIVDLSTMKVTELPPDLNLEAFKERLNTYEDEDKINSYIDRSTKVIDITIKMPRGSLKDWDDNQAIEFLKLRQKKTERIVVVDWNGKRIWQYETVQEVITKFVEWRLTWFVKRYQTRLDADLYELKYWQAVKACFDSGLPKRLGSKADRAAIESDVSTITKHLNIDDKQMDKLMSLPTYKWAQDALIIVEKNISDLMFSIAEHKDILADPNRIKSIYRQELQELKKQKF